MSNKKLFSSYSTSFELPQSVLFEKCIATSIAKLTNYKQNRIELYLKLKTAS